MKSSLLAILVLCAMFASPATCISRWFSATFNDLKFTLYRYGYCVDGLPPVTSSRFNETEYLVSQIRTFLDQGNYDNEQLANVSSLMDTICRTSAEPSYPISVHVDIRSFNSSTNPAAKETRCRAIDDALDSMYYVFRRAALNRSEPLDFSVIQFYPNETDRSSYYNLSDLINTSWITSEVVLEHVCSITNATKDYVQARSSNSSAQSRQQTVPGAVGSLVDLFDRLLEPLLGLQKRLYWESTNRLESIQTRLSSGLGAITGGIGHGLDRTRQRLFGSRLNTTNATRSKPKAVAEASGVANLTGALNRTRNVETTRLNTSASVPDGVWNSSLMQTGTTTSTTPLPSVRSGTAAPKQGTTASV